MKVLIISNMYPSKQKPYAGIFVLNQYNSLKKEYTDVELFYMLRTFTSSVQSIMKYIKASLRFIPFMFKKYDVIHLHYFFPLIILAHFYKVFHKKSKLIVTFHGSDIKEKIQSRKSKTFFRFFTKKIDTTIAVGIDLSKDIESKLELKVDKILSAGVDDTVFYKEENIIKEYDFIFVGSFIYRKGIDIIIDVIKELNNKQLSFCFVGSGEYLNSLLEIKDLYNINIFENQTQEQLRNLYNKSRYFLFPSRNEPFGLVATEAIYCGVPIIVSTSGGLKEQAIEGETGFFANTHQEVLKTIIKTNSITKEEYDIMVNKTLLANKEFSLENITKQLLKIYKIN